MNSFAKLASAACAMLVVATLPAVAEPCAERFKRMLVERNDPGPVRIAVTQKVKGAPAMRSINHQASRGHWMTEMVEPANMQWTLVHDDRMFTSTDKGKTWAKLRTLDSAANAAQSRKNLEAAAATVKDAACATETVDGVTYDTVEGAYEMAAHKTTHRDKYWIDPTTGWIARSESLTRMAGFESVVSQVIEKAPGLELPTPK